MGLDPLSSSTCVHLIFLQPLTPSTTTYYSKDCLPGSVLLTRLSTGFSPIFRSFSVKTSKTSSQSCPLTCGIPQGLVLGLLLFILYTTPLSSLIKASSIDHHLYADDTQLFISFSPNSFSDSINHLLHVVKQISSWMTSTLICL